MPGVGDLFLKTTNIGHNDMKGKPYDPKPGNYVMLTVRDTGNGMDEKTMARIFEPFFSTKGLAEATGLGLASAYGIIKAHGGYLDVESKMGYGTTFSIYLPTSNNDIVKETKFPMKLIKGNGTVLLVDDENVILDVGEQMITMMGYDVLTVNSGKAAIEKFREHHGEINIVILDMVMPEMDGGDTYDTLKKINKEVKVILSSGYSIDGKAEEIMNRGCSGFIQKPFSMKELAQKISKILGDNAVSQNSTFLQ
jgi:CheY-like chemotaxis protein